MRIAVVYPDGAEIKYTADRVPAIGEAIRTNERAAVRVADVVTNLVTGTVQVYVR